MALLTQPWALRSGLPGAVLTWGLRPLRACAEERRPCQLAMVAQALEGEVTATCRLGTGQSSTCLSPSSSEDLGDPVPGPLPVGTPSLSLEVGAGEHEMDRPALLGLMPNRW